MYERFAQLLKETGHTSADVSKATGIDPSTFSYWKSGRSTPKTDKIKKIADYFHVLPSYLTGDTDYRTIDEQIFAMPDKDNPSIQAALSTILPISPKKIPMLGDIACGSPIEPNEVYDTYVATGSDIKCDFCLRAKGDSMINAGIHDGDIVFIKQTDIVDNGEIAAIVVEGEVTLKRFFFDRENEKLVLQSENPAYSPFVYVGEELNHVRILGKAVAVQSFIR